MKFNLWKFLVLLLTGFFLFSLPQISKSLSVHDPITDWLEEPHKQIHNWRQTEIALSKPHKTDLIMPEIG